MKAMICAAFAVVSVAGCVPFGGTEGELGHGEFFYRCVDATDLTCETTPDELLTPISSIEGDELPVAVAVGAPFSVVFQRNGGAVIVAIDPASPAFVTAEGLSSDFTFEEAGTVSLLAMGAGGDVVDFTDVTALQIHDVALVDGRGKDVEAIAVKEGEQVSLHARARASTGEDLGGALAWSVTGPGARVTPDSSVVTIEGLTAGDSTIQVHVDGLTKEIPVSVTAN